MELVQWDIDRLERQPQDNDTDKIEIKDDIEDDQYFQYEEEPYSIIDDTEHKRGL